MRKADYRIVTDESVPFGRRLYRAIKAKGITQKAFAIEMGADVGQISEYVHEKRIPNAANIVKYAKYLDVSTDFLLGLSTEMRR